jgi:hypothetical protein
MISNQCRIFFYLLFCLFSPLVQAQDRRELMSLNSFSDLESEYRSIEFQAGFRPLSLGKLRWTNRFGYVGRKVFFEPYATSQDLKELRYSPVFIGSFSEKWSFRFGPTVALKSASHSLQSQGDHFYYSGWGALSYKKSDDSLWSYSFGFFMAQDLDRFRLFPSLGLRYMSRSGRHFVNVGFPKLSLRYLPHQDWDLELNLQYMGGTYTLGEASVYKDTQRRAYQEQRLLLGPELYKRIYSKLWLHLSAKYQIYNELHFMDARGKRIEKISEEDRNWVLGLGLSLR